MKENKSKKQILEQWRKMPLIQVACEKSGVARASFYRWRQKDKSFAKEIDTAIAEGEAMITDMSEAQLITLIRDKNFQAVQLWLKSHHPKYGNRLEVTGNFQQAQDKLTPEQETTVREALRLAGALSPEKPGEEKILLNESKKL
jgi:hypothetical protein